jgi:hypothetical protein
MAMKPNIMTTALSTLIVENYFSQIRRKVKYPSLYDFCWVSQKAPQLKLNKKYNNQEGIEFSLDDIELIILREATSKINPIESQSSAKNTFYECIECITSKAYRYLGAFAKHLYVIHFDKYVTLIAAKNRVQDIVNSSFQNNKEVVLGSLGSSESNALCLDFETGKDNKEIIEIGLIDYITGREFTTLVKPFHKL